MENLRLAHKQCNHAAGDMEVHQKMVFRTRLRRVATELPFGEKLETEIPWAIAMELKKAIS